MYAAVGAQRLYLPGGDARVHPAHQPLPASHYNRRMFEQVAELSARRSELAQQLISMQENTFRSISRELHDDFGQILTAIGAMLQRAQRRARARPDARGRSARGAGDRAVHARKGARAFACAASGDPG